MPLFIYFFISCILFLGVKPNPIPMAANLTLYFATSVSLPKYLNLNLLFLALSKYPKILNLFVDFIKSIKELAWPPDP